MSRKDKMSEFDQEDKTLTILTRFTTADIVLQIDCAVN